MADESKTIPDGVPIIDFKVHEDEEKITLTLEGGEQIIFVLEGESSDEGGLQPDAESGMMVDDVNAQVLPTKQGTD